jgi:hypothetical protein
MHADNTISMEQNELINDVLEDIVPDVLLETLRIKFYFLMITLTFFIYRLERLSGWKLGLLLSFGDR